MRSPLALAARRASLRPAVARPGAAGLSVRLWSGCVDPERADCV